MSERVLMWQSGYSVVNSFVRARFQACRMQPEKQRLQPLRALIVPSGAKAQRLSDVFGTASFDFAQDRKAVP